MKERRINTIVKKTRRKEAKELEKDGKEVKKYLGRKSER